MPEPSGRVNRTFTLLAEPEALLPFVANSDAGRLVALGADHGDRGERDAARLLEPAALLVVAVATLLDVLGHDPQTLDANAIGLAVDRDHLAATGLLGA